MIHILKHMEIFRGGHKWARGFHIHMCDLIRKKPEFSQGWYASLMLHFINIFPKKSGCALKPRF